MNLKRLFIENFLRYLDQIQTIKHEIDFTNSNLTSDKKQFYWAILSACLCFEQIRHFESDFEKIILRDMGIDFNALYDTLVKDKDSFNVNHANVWEFMGKIPDLQKFVAKIN